MIMSLTIADQYYLKAVDFYPYDLAQTTEALNYALSYDSEHSQANCLMGRLHMEVLKNFETAEQYFEAAIVSNLQYVDTYKLRTLESTILGNANLRKEFNIVEFKFGHGVELHNTN